MPFQVGCTSKRWTPSTTCATSYCATGVVKTGINAVYTGSMRCSNATCVGLEVSSVWKLAAACRLPFEFCLLELYVVGTTVIAGRPTNTNTGACLPFLSFQVLVCARSRCNLRGSAAGSAMPPAQLARTRALCAGRHRTAASSKRPTCVRCSLGGVRGANLRCGAAAVAEPEAPLDTAPVGVAETEQDAFEQLSIDSRLTVRERLR